MKCSETLDLVRTLASAVLDDDALLPSWSVAATLYYERIAHHILDADPATADKITEAVVALRSSYRSFVEHSQHVMAVPLLRAPEPDVGTDACCVCLQPMQGGCKRVVRLRPASGCQGECGHFLHQRCAGRLKPDAATQEFKCPLCRCSLGQRVSVWLDTEGRVPKF